MIFSPQRNEDITSQSPLLSSIAVDEKSAISSICLYSLVTQDFFIFDILLCHYDVSGSDLFLTILLSI